MNKSFHILLVVLAFCLTQISTYAASFPAQGYEGSGDDGYEIMAPESSSSATILGAIYDYDASLGGNGAGHNSGSAGNLSAVTPSFYNNGYRYEEYPLVAGVDQIWAPKQGTSDFTNVSNYDLFDLIQSSQYGWLIIDWKKDGFQDVNNDGLEDFDENPSNYGGNYQGIYVDYFMVPIGNGEIILIALASLYAAFLFYRFYRRKKMIVKCIDIK